MNPLFLVGSATVETFTGPGPEGDTYAAPVTVSGFFDEGTVRAQGSFGEELVESTRWYGPPEDYDKFVPESRVTVNDRVSQVTKRRRREAGGLFVPVAHVEVELT